MAGSGCVLFGDFDEALNSAGEIELQLFERSVALNLIVFVVQALDVGIAEVGAFAGGEAGDGLLNGVLPVGHGSGVRLVQRIC